MQSSMDIVKTIIVKDFKFLVVVRGKDGLLDASPLVKALSGKCQRKRVWWLEGLSRSTSEGFQPARAR